MIAPEIIGRFGPDYEMPVERGKIREFARALYAPWSCYLEDPSAPVPPTFLTTAGVYWGYTLERPRGTLFEGLGHDLSVPLHAEESYLFHGALPHAGDQLTARACLESATEKQGRRGGKLTFLVLLTEFHGDDGRLLAEARSTTVTTEAAPDGTDGWTAEAPDYRPRYESLEPPDPFAVIAPADWRDLKAGDGPGPVSTGPLTLLEIVRYQAACGEDNPLHYDLAHARAMGYPGLFGVGMQQAGALASYARRWLGQPAAPRSFRARFREVFWVGDALVYDGRITQIREVDGHYLANLDLHCRREGDGRTIVQVAMTFDLGPIA